MFSSVLVILLGLVVGGRSGVLYHRQPAATAEAPDYHLDDGGLRVVKLARTLVPVQVALPSVPAVSAVPAALPAALPAGPVVFAAPQILLPRVALVPQQFSHHLPQQVPQEQYISQPQAAQYTQPRSKPTYDSRQSYDSRPSFESRPSYESKHSFDSRPSFESRPSFDSKSSFDSRPSFESRPSYDNHHDGEKPYSRVQHEQFHYNNKHN